MSESIVSCLSEIAQTDLHDQAAVQVAALTMEKLVREATVKPDLGPAIADETLEKLQNLYGLFEVNLENEYAAKIINGADISVYPFYDGYPELIEAESRLADIKAKERILFIGSGPLPVSAILFAEINQAPVTCMDINGSACATSKEVINHLGMANQIEIINSCDQEYPIVGHEVVVVAAMAQPKAQIMGEIALRADAGARVIVRNTDDAMQIFYPSFESVTKIIKQDGRLVPVAKQPPPGTKNAVSSILLHVDGAKSSK